MVLNNGRKECYEQDAIDSVFDFVANYTAIAHESNNRAEPQTATKAKYENFSNQIFTLIALARFLKYAPPVGDKFATVNFLPNFSNIV